MRLLTHALTLAQVCLFDTGDEDSPCEPIEQGSRRRLRATPSTPVAQPATSSSSSMARSLLATPCDDSQNDAMPNPLAVSYNLYHNEIRLFRYQFVIVVVVVPVLIVIQGDLVLDVTLEGQLCAVQNKLIVSLVPSVGVRVTASASVQLVVVRAGEGHLCAQPSLFAGQVYQVPFRNVWYPSPPPHTL